LNRATLQMKDGYKLNMVGMMDLSVLCDRFYPTEQGYITGERGVQIEQGSDDKPICSMWQLLSYWTGLHYRWKGYKLNMVGMMDLFVLCGRFYPIEQGYIIDERGVHIEQGSDDGPIFSMWQILSYWIGLHYKWKRGTNWTGFGW
jgi:hypothetical protein